MQEIFSQLSTLVVLAGVSVAVVQYLLINHQTHLKDLISSLKELNFNETNEYDLELKRAWESAISHCKEHIYFFKPNNSILIGFIIIILLVFAYSSVLFEFFGVVHLQVIIKGITALLLLWLFLNLHLLRQIFKKEKLIKNKFDEIDKHHRLVEEVLKNYSPLK